MSRLGVLVLAIVSGCSETYFNPPPTERFYFPTGVVHLDAPGSTEGVLVVANANWDKRYAMGSVVAIPLDRLGLPAFGAPVGQGAVQLRGLDAGVQRALIQSFAGQMASLAVSPTRTRVFVPSRAEGNLVQAVDVELDGGLTLSCFPAGPDGQPDRCLDTAPSVVPIALEYSETGVPRAPSPYGVATAPRRCAVSADCGPGEGCTGGVCTGPSGAVAGTVYVTHLQLADSPLASGINFRAYLVQLDATELQVDAGSFINLGPAAGDSVAIGQRWTYVSGRRSPLLGRPDLLRLVDRSGTVLSTGLELGFAVQDGRGLALGSGETRLFIAARGPSTLLVVRLADVTSDSPTLTLVRAVPLPGNPSDVEVISRPGRGDLVVISSTGAGSVLVYDDDVGGLVAQVPAVGEQPFSLAVDRRGAGARVYVSNFSDGRVAVLDIPDVDRPQETRLVAHIGEQQLCLTRAANTAGCQGVATVDPGGNQ